MQITMLSLLKLAAVLGVAAAACTDTCGTDNGKSSYLGACQNGSKCNLTPDNCIYCTGCPAGYTGNRCEIAPSTGTGICANNGAADYLGACKNGSTCTVVNGNQIFCANCPNGYSGYRCEIAPAGTPPPTGKCAANGAYDPLGACKNGSTCTLTSGGLIYCANCPAGYTGYRCEIAPAGATTAPTKIAGQVCGTNNGADSTGGACKNGSTCTLTPEGYVYCVNCPAGYSGYRCEVAPATTGPTTAPTKIAGQVCGTDNGAKSDGGACQNGSTCTLTAQGYVYCVNCPAAYTGYRCQTPVGGTTGPTTAKPTSSGTTAKPTSSGTAAGDCGQTCAAGGTNKDGTVNACQNGSGCNLNALHCVYCTCLPGYSGDRCQTKA